MKPGSPEWHAKIEALLVQESTRPMGWWYLSFGAPGKFLGGVYLQARGHTHALMESHHLGINPGGEVLHIQVPPHIAAMIPEAFKNRLLGKADLEECDRLMSAKEPN